MHVRGKSRSAIATIEVVMTTAIMLPMLAMLAWSGMRAFRVLFTVVGSMVGSPLL